MTVFFKMRGKDVDCSTLTFREWVVENEPDTTGAQYVGTRCGQTPLDDIVIVEQWQDGADAAAIRGRNISTTAPNDGQVYVWDSVNQEWVPQDQTGGGGGGGAPSGPAGGDLTGSYPNPTLAANSVGSSEISANAVIAGKIAAGTIVNADVNASAAIAGTKINPNFGAQNISTTGTITGSAITGSSITDSTLPANRYVRTTTGGLLTTTSSLSINDLIIGGQTKGDVAYYNGSVWTRLAAGTDGYVLTTHGTSANPTWEEVAAGGGGTASDDTVTTVLSNTTLTSVRKQVAFIDGYTADLTLPAAPQYGDLITIFNLSAGSPGTATINVNTNQLIMVPDSTPLTTMELEKASGIILRWVDLAEFPDIQALVPTYDGVWCIISNDKTLDQIDFGGIYRQSNPQNLVINESWDKLNYWDASLPNNNVFGGLDGRLYLPIGKFKASYTISGKVISPGQATALESGIFLYDSTGGAITGSALSGSICHLEPLTVDGYYLLSGETIIDNTVSEQQICIGLFSYGDSSEWIFKDGTFIVDQLDGYASNSSGGGSLSGTAGGDLTGTYPNPTIASGVITNAKVSASAAIAGTKISPDFGTQDIKTQGKYNLGNQAGGFLREDFIDEYQTTSNTQQTAKAFTPTMLSSAFTTLVTVIGTKSDGTDAFFVDLQCAFKVNGAGTITQVSSSVRQANLDADTNGDCDATLDISSGFVRVRVTGALSQTWNWTIEIHNTYRAWAA